MDNFQNSLKKIISLNNLVHLFEALKIINRESIMDCSFNDFVEHAIEYINKYNTNNE